MKEKTKNNSDGLVDEKMFLSKEESKEFKKVTRKKHKSVTETEK